MILVDQLAGLREMMQRENIMFCFSGYMTEEVLSGIGSALKKKMEIETEDRSTSKGLFAIFVELVQNVIRYSAEFDVVHDKSELMDLRYGVLTVGRNDADHFFVACGNLVKLEDAHRLSSGLEHIQSLDKDGLKALYKETLKGETPEGSKGAGVGFIEIARRASHGFEYGFREIDEEHAFFSLKAYI